MYFERNNFYKNMCVHICLLLLKALVDIDWDLLEPTGSGDSASGESKFSKSNTFPRQKHQAFADLAVSSGGPSSDSPLGPEFNPARFAPTPEEVDSDGTQTSSGYHYGHHHHQRTKSDLLPRGKDIKKEYSPLVGYDTDVDR